MADSARPLAEIADAPLTLDDAVALAASSYQTPQGEPYREPSDALCEHDVPREHGCLRCGPVVNPPEGRSDG